VPLSRLQSEILRLIAASRNPESYVAGSVPLGRGTWRDSVDIDIFHDREELVGMAADTDREILEASGLEVRWLRREPMIVTAEIVKKDQSTRLEWVLDSDYRFFPAMPDKLFGYVLHPADLATNKVMAAAGRRKPTDFFDLALIHDRVLPLGAAAWAAVEKAPGFTPEGLVAEIRRTSNYRAEELNAIPSAQPVDPQAFHARLKTMFDEAEAFVARMPTRLAGMLFLQDGQPVQPDPDRLDHYVVHSGCRKGHWPGSPEISSAMLESHVQDTLKP
jgi:hypothetical protein